MVYSFLVTFELSQIDVHFNSEVTMSRKFTLADNPSFKSSFVIASCMTDTEYSILLL